MVQGNVRCKHPFQLPWAGVRGGGAGSTLNLSWFLSCPSLSLSAYVNKRVRRCAPVGSFSFSGKRGFQQREAGKTDISLFRESCGGSCHTALLQLPTACVNQAREGALSSTNGDGEWSRSPLPFTGLLREELLKRQAQGGVIGFEMGFGSFSPSRSVYPTRCRASRERCKCLQSPQRHGGKC